jgi:secreted trypsin-like serine protease
LFQFILTAAHCVAWGHEILTAKVVVGDHDFGKFDETSDEVSEHTISKVKYHLNYDESTTDFDIALIELNEPIQMRHNARPVCLAPENADFLGLNATVTGWGRIAESGAASKILREVDVKVISNEVCGYMYDPLSVTKYMLCAGDSKGGKDACQGDSGGPLVIKVRSFDITFVLLGRQMVKS